MLFGNIIKILLLVREKTLPLLTQEGRVGGLPDGSRGRGENLEGS